MKKRVFVKRMVIVLTSLIFLIGVVYLCIMSYIIFNPSKLKVENQQKTDYYARIDTFLELNNDDRQLIVGIYPEDHNSKIEYYIDQSNELYSLMKTIKYIEEEPTKEIVGIYRISFSIKDGGLSNIPVRAWISTCGYVGLYASIDAEFSSASKTRYYHINDESYEKLLVEVEKVISNGKILKY